MTICPWNPLLRRAEIALSALLAFVFETAALADAKPTPESTSAARALYEKGLKHYNLGEYARAITMFREAYRLSDAPELLFNIAQAYRLWGQSHCAQALQFYKSYLRVAPASPKSASVEAAIKDMEQCASHEPLETGEASPTTTVPPPAVTAPISEASAPKAADRGPLWIPVTLGGFALVSGLSGGALIAWARSDYHAINASGCSPECDPGKVAGPKFRQSAGIVLLGTGAASAVAALIFWLASSSGD
jgi:tetratricopeptide (TPR) repeat protein